MTQNFVTLNVLVDMVIKLFMRCSQSTLIKLIESDEKLSASLARAGASDAANAFFTYYYFEPVKQDTDVGNEYRYYIDNKLNGDANITFVSIVPGDTPFSKSMKFWGNEYVDIKKDDGGELQKEEDQPVVHSTSTSSAPPIKTQMTHGGFGAPDDSEDETEKTVYNEDEKEEESEASTKSHSSTSSRGQTVRASLTRAPVKSLLPTTPPPSSSRRRTTSTSSKTPAKTYSTRSKTKKQPVEVDDDSD